MGVSSLDWRETANALPSLTPFNPATMVQSLDERGRGVRVVFFRPPSAADRWGHVVATVLNGGEAGETVVPQLVSQEGPGPNGWPLSPPLQSLAIEERAAGAVALLVGMSGQSHWSASFEAIAGSRRVVIDIACRLANGAAQPRLGSHYVAQDNWPTLDLQFGPGIVMEKSSSGVSLEAHSTPQQPVRWKYTIGPPDFTTKP